MDLNIARIMMPSVVFIVLIGLVPRSCASPGLNLEQEDRETGAKPYYHCDPSSNPEDINLRIPGSELMQFGYNIVTGRSTMSNAHNEILDTWTATNQSQTIAYGGHCYIVPDAFVTAQSVGVLLRSSSSKQIWTSSASSLGYLREKQTDKFADDLSIDFGPFQPVSINAAFSRSRELKLVRTVHVLVQHKA